VPPARFPKKGLTPPRISPSPPPSSEAQAHKLLKAANWSVEAAADRFFESGMVPDASSSASAPAPAAAVTRKGSASGGAGAGSASSSAAAAASSKRVQEEFARFADPSDPDVMGEEALVPFSAELDIDPFADPVILVLAHRMGCRRQGPFQREEFARGMAALGCETVAQLRARLPSLRADLASPLFFPKFWVWAYEYSCEEGQKSIPLDVVRPLTTMLLPASKWSLVGDWVEWLGTQEKTVTKDTWTLLLDLSARVKPDLSNYDDESSWPVQFDDFVEWMRAGKKSKAGRR
jgi:hypothetical protein